MIGFILGFLFGIYFWRCWTWPKVKPVKPGFNKSILLPHIEELEFHHNTKSSNSQKVRACLNETGLNYREIHYELDGLDTKSADFLNNVNPAGTVPVLIHNGHPIYESHEQIMYIDQVLLKDDCKLTPNDPAMKALMDKWVESGSMYKSEMNPTGFSKRFGNLLFPMSLPMFAAMFSETLTIWKLLSSLSNLPLLSDRKIVMMQFLFKIYGAKGFQKMKFLHDTLSSVSKGIEHHFSLLTKDLEASDGQYICGTQFTLADISLIPILERMTYAGWWTQTLENKYPLVAKYWKIIQERKSYQSSKANQESQRTMIKLGNVIDQWKTDHKWFKDYFEYKN